MQRIRKIRQSILDSGGSTVDGNKLYSILLDARASKVSENMFDVAENLVGSEKENAKGALEQLWALKRDMQSEHETGTVDLLIKFYQEKLNVLRNKEENIKRISKDSRTLLEDKRKRDSEIAAVKQEISDCSIEINRLNTKLHKLRVKEQELTLIETQVSKELKTNANEIVNGLYEIILTQQSFGAEDQAYDEAPVEPDSAAPAAQEIAQEETHGVDIFAEKEIDGADESGEDVILLERLEKTPLPVLPKSVVKTTKGIVIGEYYYNPKVYKNERHYIFSSNFLHQKLASAVRSLQLDYEQGRYGEAIQMVQDAYKRIDSNENIHFEVSTNEILNLKTLKEMYHDLRARKYEEVLIACNKLKAKIAALGSNYSEMLAEQMKRLTGS